MTPHVLDMMMVWSKFKSLRKDFSSLIILSCKLALGQVIVVVVVVPDDSNFAVAHTELLLELLPEVVGCQLDAMLSLQGLEQVGQLQRCLVLTDVNHDQTRNPFLLILEKGPFLLPRLFRYSLL
jgi:hypothetical protein